MRREEERRSTYAPENNIVARVVSRQPKNCLYEWKRGSLKYSFAVFNTFRSLFIFVDN